MKRVGDKCLFPHHKVDEQPNKKPKKSYFPKGRESDDKNAVAIVKSVSQFGLRLARLGSIGLSKRKKALGTPDAESLVITECTLRHASIRDKKRPPLGKIQVKPRHQRSPHALKFEDKSHEKTERQERCARSKAWDLDKNMFKLDVFR